MMTKRGQLQISFGMIFSILVIIATLAIAFYVISYFFTLSKCVNSGYLYENMNKKVDEAWKAGIVKDVYVADVPSGIEKICFGNLTQVPAAKDTGVYDELRSYGDFIRIKANVFLYPPNQACETSLAYYNLAHARTDNFFCKEASKGKINITLEKGVFDPLVKISS